MKSIVLGVGIMMMGTLAAAGFHRSFKNGLPANAKGEPVARVATDASEIKAPQPAKPKTKVKVTTNVVVRCAAVTKAGNQCMRRAIPDGRYCRQHSFIEERDGSMPDKKKKKK